VPTSVPTSAPAAPVATIAAQEEAWLRTTADLAGLSEFVERVSRSSLAPADAAIVNADVLTRAVVAGLRQRTVLGPVEVTVHLTVYDAGGRSTTVTLAADQLGSIVSVSDARKRLAAGTDAAGRASQPGPTSDQPGGPISQPGPSAPVRVAIVDLSAERLERSPTLRYADTPIRLTLGPAVVPATIGGREAHATGEAQLLLEYDHSVLDDERAATLIYHVSRLVADPFALAVQG
jgi:hypothetical protein